MPKDAENFSLFRHIMFNTETHNLGEVNERRILMKRAITVIVICLLLLAGHAFPASAGPMAGTVTTWGDGSTRSVLVAFPTGVVPVSISAYEYMGGMALTQDGSLYEWFGVSDAVPTRITFPPEVTQVIAASKRMSHTLARTDDGLYSWGANSRGQLGDGTLANRSVPAKVIFPPEVTSVSGVAAGYTHSLAITNDGLYAWGDNFNGELGNGTQADSSLPVKVIFPSTVTSITQIAAGRSSSYAITNDGLYAWGNNWTGQIGNGSSGGNQILPVKVRFSNRVTAVTDIEAGENYALAITNDGVYAWGLNLSGSLGTGSGTTAVPMKVRFPKAVTAVTEIAASTNHTLAITNDGLYAWGNNSAGQLGINKNNVFTPLKVPGEDNAIDVSTSEYSTIALH
jgi:alpha-tubulin suppressor-like RCC1 family protein